MGAFYGSVQIRGDDRQVIQQVLEEVARKKKFRFLLGPVINGWIGVYPEGKGQDNRVAKSLARQLPHEILHLMVHDDDVFAYEYYRDGRLIDQYNSCPDYFEKVPDRERENLRGRPETLAHLAIDEAKFAALEVQLTKPEDEAFVFISELLLAFAGAFGIRNALTSYEYLKEGETDEVEGWSEFIHIPDQSREEVRRRKADEALGDEIRRLLREGLLLAERGGLKGWDTPYPRWCPSPDGRGFFVGWCKHTEREEGGIPLERYGPPWSAVPHPSGMTIDPLIYNMALSPSGRYLAVGHAAGAWKAVLWDLRERRRITEVDHTRAVSWTGFMPDESAMISVSSHQAGEITITPIDGGTPRIIAFHDVLQGAVHPTAGMLVVSGNSDRLSIVDLNSGAVKSSLSRVKPGVPPALAQLMARSIQTQLAQIDLEGMEQKLQENVEKQLQKFAQMGLLPGTETIDESRERMRQEAAEYLKRIRDQFAQVGTPDWQAGLDLNPERYSRLKFDLEGRYLLVATSQAARVYRWEEMARATDHLPDPFATVAGDNSPIEAGRGVMLPGGTIYDLDYDPERERVIFAGLDGRVRFLDLATRHSGVLMDVPGRPPIIALGLSGDRSVLCCTCDPGMFDRGKDRRGPLVRFWNYPLLCRKQRESGASGA
jgi:WD40 repeat protein